MKTRLDKAMEEQEMRSPFVCESCDERYGHPRSGGDTRRREQTRKETTRV